MSYLRVPAVVLAPVDHFRGSCEGIIFFAKNYVKIGVTSRWMEAFVLRLVLISGQSEPGGSCESSNALLTSTQLLRCSMFRHCFHDIK